MALVIFLSSLFLNLQGTFLVTKAAGREMIASGVAHAVIANVASFVGKLGKVGVICYVASKGGVTAPTKSATQKLDPEGIHCNAILPGVTMTPMTSSCTEERKTFAMNATPLRRLGQPEEIAEDIKLLCLPGSSFTTSSMVEVTGGVGM